MSSPIPLDDTVSTSISAAPRARDRIRPVKERTSRSQPRIAAAAKMSSRRSKPKFSGDRAMLALQRELARDPDLIPAPSSGGAGVIGPLLIRLCSVTALAALVAWAVISFSAVKKTAEVIPAATSASAIASNHGNAVDVQPLRLRPALSQAAEAPSQASKSTALTVARADATPATVAVTPPAASESPDMAPPPQPANNRQVLRLDSEEIATLLKRGGELLAHGDLAAARLVFRRAAEAGSADGALALGTTFDPAVLQRLGTIGAAADLARARKWYERAAELGSSTASQQLAGLAEAR